MCRLSSSQQPGFRLIAGAGCALVAGLFLLGGCASTPSSSPPPPPPPPSEQSSQQSESSEQTQAEQKEQDKQSAPAESESAEQGTPPPVSEGQAQAKQQSGEQGAQGQDEQQAGATGSTAGGSATTQRERGQQVESEFDRSLADFDERLAREQGELGALGDKQAQADEQRENQDGRSSGAFEGETVGVAPPPPTGVRDGIDDESSDGQSPAESSERRRPGSPGDKASLPPTPEDVPSGQNDDVVARQLREAAENETDPELREKLWDEYRQYKRNNG